MPLLHRQLSNPQQGTVSVGPAQEQREAFKFRCPHCGVALKIAANMVGQRGTCPKCFQEFVPRTPNRAADRQRTQALDDEYRLRNETSPPPSQEELIPIVCTLCHTRMYARVDQLGQTIKCPDCDTQNRVARRRQVKQTRSNPITTGSTYKIDPPPFDSGPREESSRLLAKAAEEVAEIERKKPKAPRRPFFSRVISILWQPRIAVMYSSLTVAVTADIGFILSVERVFSLFIPIVCGIIAFITLLIVVYASVSLINITEKTAAGLDIIDEWPPFEMMDWAFQSFFLITSVTCCAVPAIIVVNTIGYSFEALAWCGVVGYFLFPLVLLSTLEADSPAILFDARVWRSLVGAWSSWLVFYFEICLLAGAVGGLAWWLRPGVDMWRILPLVLVSNVALILYFRLIGRLAWVIGRHTPEAERRVKLEHGKSES